MTTYSVEIIHLKEDDPKSKVVGLHIKTPTSIACTLRGGLTQVIIDGAERRTDGNKQTFLGAIVIAMMHCTMTGSIPTVSDT